jgi:hypothetical protein
MAWFGESGWASGAYRAAIRFIKEDSIPSASAAPGMQSV